MVLYRFTSQLISNVIDEYKIRTEMVVPSTDSTDLAVNGRFMLDFEWWISSQFTIVLLFLFQWLIGVSIDRRKSWTTQNHFECRN